MRSVRVATILKQSSDDAFSTSIGDNCTTLQELSANLYKLGKHHWSGPIKLPTRNCESACKRTAYLELQGKLLQRHSIESFQRS